MMRARIERSTAQTFSTATPRVVLACGWMVLAGCDGCDSPPQPPPPKLADAGVLDMAPAPKVAELLDSWRLATGSYAESEAQPFELAYTIPTCSVRYQLRSVVLGEVAEGREPAGVEIIAELVGNPAAGRLTWQLVGMQSFLLHDGERSARPQNLATWGPALVQTDGRSWAEDRGPSTLWAAHSSVPPLLMQFPRLEPDAQKGKPYSWTADTFTKRATSKVEERREKQPDAGVPRLPAERHEIQVALEEFRQLVAQDTDAGAGASTRVAVLTGSWTTEKNLIDPIESQRAERWKARWAIAENGRLIHAISLAGRYQWWAVSASERNSKLGSAEVELRLVEDCDTPTLPRFDTAK